MTGNLDGAIKTLLQTALPDLFGGEPPAVVLTVSSALFEVDPHSAEGVVGEPRPDDRRDDFWFDPDAPPDSFTLTQPPYPGPRRVYLVTETGDRIPLRPGEVAWDEVDSRVFALDLRPTHDLSAVNGVQVLYGVTAVFGTLKADQTLSLQLESDDAGQLAQAEALAIGVIELNKQALVDQATVTYEVGDYGATVAAKSLKLLQGAAPAPNQRRLTYHAEIELKATRALRDDEGQPIARIRTPGRPLDPERRIDVHIDVQA